MKYARIIGSGSYLPEKCVTNHALEELFETSHDWIVERTGIHTRHLAADDQNVSDLAYIAAQRALEQAQLPVDAIDLIIVATTTPDRAFPSTACLLQHRLGCRPCIAFDVTAACAGFIYAVSVADQFIRAGTVNCALVIGSECMSRTVDWSDRGTAILFGDGAGALLLQAAPKPGILGSYLHAAGEYQDILYLPQPSFQKPMAAASECTMRMRGAEVFKHAVEKMSEVVLEALAAQQLSADDVDWLIPHQANLRIIQAIAKRLNFPEQKVVVTVAEHANTSAASVGLAFDLAVRDGRIQRGHKVILEGFGGGLTWGAILLEY